MNTEYYKKFEPIFNTWHITGLIGEGSYGKVFEIEREDFGTTYKAALKAITIPSSESEIKSVMADGMDDVSVRSYYENFVEDIVKEFVLMSKLKGNSNIVSYEDHMVIEHKNSIGWDILIRMELLTPLFDHIKTIDLKRKDVIKLGIDMCKALELCQKYNIIHRDIKPENIFISGNGDYKLGDFGIARTLEQTSGMLSKKGTQAYMAPEIYREEAYGSNVDIYSLGIVMYRLLNENRTPFLPAYPAPITHSDRESAIKKRISGAPLPVPKNADGRLAEIVLKACSYDPKERYFSPMEMREELEAILYNKEEGRIIYPSGDDTPIKSLKYIETGKSKKEWHKTATETIFTEKENSAETKTEGKTIGQQFGNADEQTETVFKRSNQPYAGEKTESGFDFEENKSGNATESFFKQRSAVKKTKRREKGQKRRKLYAAVAAAVILIGVVTVLMPKGNTGKGKSQAVNSPEVLNDSVVFTIAGEGVPSRDFEVLLKRLDAYGKKYYADETSGRFALQKSDMGDTEEEIMQFINLFLSVGDTDFDKEGMTERLAALLQAVEKSGKLTKTYYAETEKGLKTPFEEETEEVTEDFAKTEHDDEREQTGPKTQNNKNAQTSKTANAKKSTVQNEPINNADDTPQIQEQKDAPVPPEQKVQQAAPQEANNTGMPEIYIDFD